MTELNSALYSGWVRHRRMSPKSHSFRYQVFMVYLDLDELELVFELSPFWSAHRWAPARFKRNDFHGNPKLSLRQAIVETIKLNTGRTHRGPIRVLANLRYFGFIMNPLTTYYCFDPSGSYLEFIVAEVNNTPWGEKHAYVLSCSPEQQKHEFDFAKTFHVSPFNPLTMEYRWLSTTPDKKLLIHLENWQANVKVSDATLHLQRQSINARSMNLALIRYPFMTVKVIASIYWQALRLWFKGVPYFAHPKNVPNNPPIYPRQRGTSNEVH
jgi:uncharacterized protein